MKVLTPQNINEQEAVNTILEYMRSGQTQNKVIHDLNEFRSYNNKPWKTSGIRDYDQYNLATKVIAPLCSQYFKYAVYAKVNTKLSAPRKDNDNVLHKAAFTAKVASLDNPKAVEKMNVACKIYNEDRMENVVYIKWDDIHYGNYNLFATIIAGTCFYLDYTAVMRYFQELGNSAIKTMGKDSYIVVDGDYWMNEARYEAEMDESDKTMYRQQYDYYMRKK